MVDPFREQLARALMGHSQGQQMAQAYVPPTDRGMAPTMFMNADMVQGMRQTARDLIPRDYMQTPQYQEWLKKQAVNPVLGIPETNADFVQRHLTPGN